MTTPRDFITRTLLLLVTMFITSGASAAQDSVADIDATTARWISAFNRKSTTDIVALYAKDAVLLGTTSPVLRDKPELVQEYFKSLPSLGDATITLGEHRVQLFGDIAVSSGFYTRTAVEDGKTVSSPARFTFVYAKRDGRWLILTHHSSVLP